MIHLAVECKGDKKTLAIKIKDYPLKSIIFKLDNPEDTSAYAEKVWNDNVNNVINFIYVTRSKKFKKKEEIRNNAASENSTDS